MGFRERLQKLIIECILQPNCHSLKRSHCQIYCMHIQLFRWVVVMRDDMIDVDGFGGFDASSLRLH